MKAIFGKISVLLSGLLFLMVSCDKTAVGPDDIGGDTDIELTEEGGKFGAYFDFDGYDVAFHRIKDSIIITRSSGGMVTFYAQFIIDSAAMKSLDTLFGTANLSRPAKIAAVEQYIAKFNGTIDTSNLNAVKVSFQYKIKITSEGMQEYFTDVGRGTKPFTIVKYSSNVGDKYEFTDVEGVKTVREVKYKSTTNDYSVGFFNIKVMKVEEKKENDPFISKIIYIANHKYGMVGIETIMKSGKEIKMGIFPPNM